MPIEDIPQEADLPDSMDGLNRFMNVVGTFKNSVEACVTFSPGVHIEARVKMEIEEAIGSGAVARGLALDSFFQSLMDRFEIVREEASKIGFKVHLVFHEDEGVADKKFAEFKSRVIFEVERPAKIVALIKDMKRFFEGGLEQGGRDLPEKDLDSLVQNLFDSMFFSYDYKNDLPPRTAEDNPMELNGVLAILGENFSCHNKFLKENGALFLEIRRMFDDAAMTGDADLEKRADKALQDVTWFLTVGKDELDCIAKGHFEDIDFFDKEIESLHMKALEGGEAYQEFYRRMRDEFVEALRKNKMVHEEWKFAPNSQIAVYPELIKINKILDRLLFHSNEMFN